VNINMLRDEDDDIGHYLAVCAANQTGHWAGCTIRISSDGGTVYSPVAIIKKQSILGTVTNALGNFFGGEAVDELNYINANLRRGTLESTDYDGLLSGLYAVLVGDEIIFYRDATLELDGTVTLRGLLRGRRGSEYAMSTHVAGERFVFLDPATLSRITHASSYLGVQRYYKAVTDDASIASTPVKLFTNEGVNLMPYAVVHIGGGRDASGNIIINWVRRARKSAEWRSGVDVPLGEVTEAYVVEIYDGSSYGEVLRTVETSVQTITYTAAQQTSDFGSLQSTVYIRVYQLNSIIGRGHAASGSV
jgi:hypothetical protein